LVGNDHEFVGGRRRPLNGALVPVVDTAESERIERRRDGKRDLAAGVVGIVGAIALVAEVLS
jgi:hypothetical protein